MVAVPVESTDKSSPDLKLTAVKLEPLIVIDEVALSAPVAAETEPPVKVVVPV